MSNQAGQKNSPTELALKSARFSRKKPTANIKDGHLVLYLPAYFVRPWAISLEEVAVSPFGDFQSLTPAPNLPLVSEPTVLNVQASGFGGTGLVLLFKKPLRSPELKRGLGILGRWNQISVDFRGSHNGLLLDGVTLQVLDRRQCQERLQGSGVELIESPRDWFLNSRPTTDDVEALAESQRRHRSVHLLLIASTLLFLVGFAMQFVVIWTGWPTWAPLVPLMPAVILCLLAARARSRIK